MKLQQLSINDYASKFHILSTPGWLHIYIYIDIDVYIYICTIICTVEYRYSIYHDYVFIRLSHFPFFFCCKAQLTLKLLQRHRAVTARVQLAEDVADPIHASRSEAAAVIVKRNATGGSSPVSEYMGLSENNRDIVGI